MQKMATFDQDVWTRTWVCMQNSCMKPGSLKGQKQFGVGTIGAHTAKRAKHLRKKHPKFRTSDFPQIELT